jgi:pimeloyl-ACP methyl ester carboxylesterase
MRRKPGRTGLRPRRRTVLVAVPVVLAALLLVNAVLVEQQASPATASPTVSVEGGQLYVTDEGPRVAPAIVLIHGFGGSVRWWDLLVPGLAERHRVIRVDLLGHGRSAKPAGGGYGIAEQGRRVGEALDLLGVGEALVVGHSTGGSVATSLAEQRRDLVTALALVNSGPRIEAVVPQGPAGRLLEIPVVGHLLWRVRTDTLIRRAAATAVTRDVPLPEAIIDDARGMTYHAFTATSQAAEDYLRQRPLPDRLAALGTPLLVIFGAEDRRWLSSSAAGYRAVPSARIEMLTGVGHSPPLEEPVRTAELLLSFAAARPPRAGG